MQSGVKIDTGYGTNRGEFLFKPERMDAFLDTLVFLEKTVYGRELEVEAFEDDERYSEVEITTPDESLALEYSVENENDEYGHYRPQADFFFKNDPSKDERGKQDDFLAEEQETIMSVFRDTLGTIGDYPFGGWEFEFPDVPVAEDDLQRYSAKGGKIERVTLPGGKEYESGLGNLWFDEITSAEDIEIDEVTLVDREKTDGKVYHNFQVDAHYEGIPELSQKFLSQKFLSQKFFVEAHSSLEEEYDLFEATRARKQDSHTLQEYVEEELET
jgi:hypothetical protein